MNALKGDFPAMAAPALILREYERFPKEVAATIGPFARESFRSGSALAPGLMEGLNRSYPEGVP